MCFGRIFQVLGELEIGTYPSVVRPTGVMSIHPDSSSFSLLLDQEIYRVCQMISAFDDNKCHSSAQNQSQDGKFGFKILSKNHMKVFLPIDTLLIMLILIYLFCIKNLKA